MSLKLQFLKSKKWPRIAPADVPEKAVNQSFDDKLDDHLMGELMAAVEQKHVGQFRQALEALVLNQFEGTSDAA